MTTQTHREKPSPKRRKKVHRHRYKTDQYGWVQCSICHKVKSLPDCEMYIQIAEACYGN